MNTATSSNTRTVNEARMDTSKPNVDFLIGLETQMKSLWQQYVERLDQNWP